jgi:hypothetical protein
MNVKSNVHAVNDGMLQISKHFQLVERTPWHEAVDNHRPDHGQNEPALSHWGIATRTGSVFAPAIIKAVMT